MIGNSRPRHNDVLSNREAMNDNLEEELKARIAELEAQLEESRGLVDAIQSGEVDAFAISKDNVSEIRTLYSGDHAYRAMVEQMGEGALNVSDEGIILFANPHFQELVKKNKEEIIGSSLFDYIHPSSVKKFTQLFEQALNGQVKGEIVLRINRKKVPMYLSLTSLQPELDTIGVVLTDLTELKENEKLILRYQRNLQHKNKELRNTNEELASFVYIASHDLQEPLRKIQTFISRIQEREKDQLSERGNNYFNRIDDAAFRMKNLITDLLSYSKASNADENYEPVELDELVREVRSDLRELIRENGAVLHFKDLGTLPVIRFQFKQMLTNLLSNAIKFCHPDRTPEVWIQGEFLESLPKGVSKIPKAAAYYHLQIRDNGIGFDSKYKNRIFELFQRLHNRKNFGGTGIGLAIVNKIVRIHKGRITASGKPDKGAQFDLYFPVQD